MYALIAMRNLHLNKCLNTLLLVCLAGCGGANSYKEGYSRLEQDDFAQGNYIVRARSEMPLNINDANMYAASSNAPINVSMSASVTFSLNLAGLNPPAITIDLLNFGNIAISDLKDNNLKVCGGGGNQKCNNAYIRIYTIGANPGLYDATEGYGIPMFANSLLIGHTNSAATTVSSYAIPISKKNLKLSDFSPTPNYVIQADFSNASIGSFSTTLVVEYILGL